MASQTGGTPNIAEIDGPARFGDAGIETIVNLHDVPGSALFVVATAASGENIQYGSNGIGASNNGGDPAVTLTPNGVPRLEFFGGPGGDQITAQGGSLTGAPRTDPVHLRGGAGTDSLVAGDGDDTMSGADGFADTIFGDAGNDTIDPGAGDDEPLDGGDGIDTLSFQDSPAGVQVDLALSNIRQNTGPEGLNAFAEDRERHRLRAHRRPAGRRRPKPPQRVRGQRHDRGPGRNGRPPRRRQRRHHPGPRRRGRRRRLRKRGRTRSPPISRASTRCSGRETALFLPVQSGGGTGPPSGGGTTTPRDDRDRADRDRDDRTGWRPVAAARECGRRRHAGAVLSSARPRAVPSRFLVDRRGQREVALSGAARGTTFRYALSEAARVTFTIERKRPGRCGRAKRRCARFKRVAAFAADGVAGPNAKRFSGRIGRRTLAPAAYRALVTATDAAGNRSVAATVWRLAAACAG